MPEQTMQQAAAELHAAVIALQEFLEREYPSRREVERRFVSKVRSRQRWYLVLTLIMASAFISFLGTVTTVSTCFLGDSHHPGICKALPGYSETQERTDKIVQLFTEFQATTTRNSRRIDRLEKRK